MIFTKPLAIVLSLLLVAGIIFTGYLYTTCQVSVGAVSVIASQASSQERTFSSLKEAIAQHASTGILYTDEPLGDADAYQFLTYTVTLQNTCFVPANLVEIQVTPQSGDVLQLLDNTEHILAARSQNDFQATILTGIENNNIRELQVTYTMWGIPFHLKANYTGR